MRSRKLIFLSIISSVLMTGCASKFFSGFDNDEFSCPAPLHGGVKCKAAREVYEMTHTTDSINSSEQQDKTSKRWGVVGSKGDEAEKPSVRESEVKSVRQPNTVLPEVDKPLPIRTSAKVMRLWIAPWEDAAGDLNIGGYVFTEIESRKWNLGDDQIAKVPVLNPLAVPNSPNSLANTSGQMP